MRRRLTALLALAGLATVAGCGSDSKDSKSPNGVESKPPQQILDETAAALERVETFHLEATQGPAKKGTSIKADVGLPTKLRLAIAQGDAAASILVVDGALYIRANAAFWKQQQSGRAAAALAGKWLKPPTSSGELRKLTEDIDPATLSRCLVKDHGTLTSGGTTTVDGERAVVIIDKGDRPGTAPGKLFVAATGEPLPLRTLATGTERPGGTKDPLCDDSTRTKAGDEAVFSNYDESLDLKAPPSAVDLGTGKAS